jgi:hypothetical protein
MPDTTRGAQRGNLPRLTGGFGPQSMIDGDGHEPRRRGRVVQVRLQEQKQRSRIAAAGDGSDDAAFMLETIGREQFGRVF